MSELIIPVRYYYLDAEGEEERDETKFHFVHKVIKIDPKSSALVLVDVWKSPEDVSEMKNAYDRVANIAKNKLAPAVEAARKVGMCIIHAPSPPVAKKYPHLMWHAKDSEVAPSPRTKGDWPPREFIRRVGEYSEYARLRRRPVPDDYDSKREIDDSVKPVPGDFVIATGEQLHGLLLDKKVLHLFYAGFAANMCLQFRDYGMEAMSRRGYNLILLRDCTTAIESSETLRDLLTTKITVQQIEILWGFSTISEDFIKACNELRP